MIRMIRMLGKKQAHRALNGADFARRAASHLLAGHQEDDLVYIKDK